MLEDTVRNVVSSYLKEQGHKPFPPRGAGPDLLLDGIAIETKGSRFELKNALDQFTRYAFSYSHLGIGFPIDAPSMDLFQKLRYLESAIRSWKADPQASLSVYLVAEKEKNKYVLRKYTSVEDLLKTIQQRLEQKFFVSSFISGDVEDVITEIQITLSQVDALWIEALKEDLMLSGYEVSLE